jgi:hypothetical protein
MGKLSLVFVLVLVYYGCALEQHKQLPQLNTLIQFNAAVLDTPGMEDEQRQIIVTWIADGIRVLIVQPKQWEGQARLNWPKVRSMCGPYDNLLVYAAQIDRLLQ